uniref:G-protein coupled receptors family 1 profile domain-containing protein n=1 Tax=Panagrolaimus superbus TaxID=310955 RepID=A0A914YB92_9BILA
MELETQETNVIHESYQNAAPPPPSVIIRRDFDGNNCEDIGRIKKSNKNNFEKCVAFQPGNHEKTSSDQPMISYEKVKRHKQRKERMYRKSLQKKPKAISAAKERRGVKVLGIILGCFTICWTPFFVMYVIVQFWANFNVNPHIEMFITWLGYSNSAMNPIIYTVFNRDYQIALKRLFTNTPDKMPLRPNL